jgi:hypothetical protein
VHDVLQARIQCVVPPISLLLAAVLRLEAYMGIEPHFNQWNYFFRARLRQGSDVKAMVLDSVVIYVRFRPEVDPYFFILMPDPLVGWRRA